MLEKDQYVAVWRLDGNIHPLWELGRRLQAGTPKEKEPITLSLRPNLRDALRFLSDKHNFVHVVHTDEWQRVRDLALEATGLTGNFKEAVSRYDYTDKGYPWPARYFAETLRLSPEEATHRMIVMGSASYDLHTDLPGVVYLEQDHKVDLTSESDAMYCANKVVELLQTGEGSFNRGFERWYEGAKRREHEENDPKLIPIRTHPFTSGWFALLSYDPVDRDLLRDAPSRCVPVIKLLPSRPRIPVETFTV